MHNVAYRLALLISVGGLVLLAMAGPGDDLQTTLGAMGLVGAGLERVSVSQDALDIEAFKEITQLGSTNG